MAETQMRSMTPEEFYEWQLDQDERYELVEGVPVPLRAMTGASNVHDVILVNCIIELGTRLRGKPCRVASADTALSTSIRASRRPDVTVDSAPPDGRSYEAGRPTVVIEVLSFDTQDRSLHQTRGIPPPSEPAPYPADRSRRRRRQALFAPRRRRMVGRGSDRQGRGRRLVGDRGRVAAGGARRADRPAAVKRA